MEVIKLIYIKNPLICYLKFKKLNKTKLKILMEKIIRFQFMMTINYLKKLNYFLTGIQKNMYLKKNYKL